MSIIRNIGLLILLALFGAGGFFVREGLLVWEENKALKESPELAQVSDSVRARIDLLNNNMDKLASQKVELEEQVKELTEQVDELTISNTTYFEKLKACEAGDKMEDEDVDTAKAEMKDDEKDSSYVPTKAAEEAEKTAVSQPKNVITPVKNFIEVKDTDSN